MKITIGKQDGETVQTEKQEIPQLTGKKIGDEFSGDVIGLEGYTLRITGGSDRQGFPMRESIEGTERQKKLLKTGTGVKEKENGIRERKSVRGNTVSNQTEQLNTKVVEQGEDEVDELLESQS